MIITGDQSKRKGIHTIEVIKIVIRRPIKIEKIVPSYM